MKYITIDINGNFGFKDDADNQILETDVKISDNVYNTFFEIISNSGGINLKNINGDTFDEIFEVLPIPVITEKESIQNELNELDKYLPRCVEDLITVQGVDITTLPQIMQDRISRKEELRTQLQTILGS